MSRFLALQDPRGVSITAPAVPYSSLLDDVVGFLLYDHDIDVVRCKTEVEAAEYLVMATRQLSDLPYRAALHPLDMVHKYVPYRIPIHTARSISSPYTCHRCFLFRLNQLNHTELYSDSITTNHPMYPKLLMRIHCTISGSAWRRWYPRTTSGRLTEGAPRIDQRQKWKRRESKR